MSDIPRHGAPGAGHWLRIADLELDLLRCRAHRNGHSLCLTPKEFRVLAFLMQRPGAVFAAQELAEQVWEMDPASHGKPNPRADAVAITMRRLRKKIDAGHESKLLHMTRGGGYMLAESLS